MLAKKRDLIGDNRAESITVVEVEMTDRIDANAPGLRLGEFAGHKRGRNFDVGAAIRSMVPRRYLSLPTICHGDRGLKPRTF
jgi:hypothetical protein